MSRNPACEAWQEAISAYLDGALALDQELRVHAHLRTCGACSRFLVDLVPVVQAVRSLPAPKPPRDLWPALERQLAREALFRGRSRPFFRPAMGLAAAAVMVAVGLGYAGFQQATAVPVADVDMYWHQHGIFSREGGEPTLYAPEWSAIEASYQLDE